MAGYILRRLWQLVPTLAGVVLLIFFLFKLFGGDPAQILAGQIATQEQIDAIRRELGLDQSWYVQLGIFVREILTFDWGKSWITHEQVSAIFVSRLPATLTITIPILVLEAAMAIPTAMLVAYYRGTLLDRTVIALCVAAMSVSFLVYIIVGQYLFGFQLGWFPVQGWSDSFWRNLAVYAPLPIILATLVSLAPQTRLYRSFFLDETKSDYVRTARAKGLSDPAILRRHVLPNAMVPVLTNVALLLPGVFVGSFLLEIFFSIPGLGREVYIAVNRSDYPVIQAFTVYLSVLTMFINLGADVLYRLVDPRIQLA
jgi:peptide/nickel transport system permease protein